MSTATEKYRASLIAIANHDPGEAKRALRSKAADTIARYLQLRQVSYLLGALAAFVLAASMGAAFYADSPESTREFVVICGLAAVIGGMYALASVACTSAIKAAKSRLADRTRELDPSEVAEVVSAIDSSEDLRPHAARWVAAGPFTVRELELIRESSRLQADVPAIEQ